MAAAGIDIGVIAANAGTIAFGVGVAGLAAGAIVGGGTLAVLGYCAYQEWK